MGKPLIGTDVAGSRELIDDGVTGLLCRARDAKSLADAMQRMAVLPHEQLQQMGRAGRKKIEREFSEAAVVRAYLDALQDAVRK